MSYYGLGLDAAETGIAEDFDTDYGCRKIVAGPEDTVVELADMVVFVDTVHSGNYAIADDMAEIAAVVGDGIESGAELIAGTVDFESTARPAAGKTAFEDNAAAPAHAVDSDSNVGLPGDTAGGPGGSVHSVGNVGAADIENADMVDSDTVDDHTDDLVRFDTAGTVGLAEATGSPSPAVLLDILLRELSEVALKKSTSFKSEVETQ